MSFFAHLWDKFGRIAAPIQAEFRFTPRPQGSEAREPVSDEDQKRTRAHVEHRRAVMDIGCTLNNAYVFRNYGRGPVVERETAYAVIEVPEHMAHMNRHQLQTEFEHDATDREPSHL